MLAEVEKAANIKRRRRKFSCKSCGNDCSCSCRPGCGTPHHTRKWSLTRGVARSLSYLISYLSHLCMLQYEYMQSCMQDE
jgi:hypothetical protein